MDGSCCACRTYARGTWTYYRVGKDMFRFLTSGESHGPGLTAILEGIPAGLKLSAEDIDIHLKRRQGGYGRGGRMKIEQDRVIFRSGVRHGLTLGSPITLEIENRDWQNWQVKMSVTPVDEPVEAVTLVRPGHADFAGVIKYGHQDIRNVIERSSARETAARVAVGAVCQALLHEFGIEIHSHVLSIGPVGSRDAQRSAIGNAFTAAYWEQVEQSPVRCGSHELEVEMINYIQHCKSQGETCGGVFEVVATGVPVGLGSYSQWDRRLNARLALALMSIPSVKGVEMGAGVDASAAVKPISTLAHALPTLDVRTLECVGQGGYERSEVFVMPAGGVVGQAML